MKKVNGIKNKAMDELFAVVNDLRSQAETAQEMNRLYRDYVRSQELKIETLKVELRIKDLEIEQLKRG